MGGGFGLALGGRGVCAATSESTFDAVEDGCEGLVDHGEVRAENSSEGFPGRKDAEGDAGPYD